MFLENVKTTTKEFKLVKINGWILSPLILLKFKILQNKKDIEILKFEHELYKAYIEFL